MHRHHHRSIPLCAVAITMCVSFQLFAGMLTPPPGPPTPTMKTLEQVEPRTIIDTLPYTISVRGSYYLTSNLAGLPGNDGITINASDVTIDLNGFTLIGSATTRSAITVAGVTHRNITIRNGNIESWGDHGVDTFGAENTRLDSLSVVSNGDYGLFLGPRTIVTNCQASNNGVSGIYSTGPCRITNCTASENGNFGIEAYNAAVISHCVADSNVSGISCTFGTVSDCAARGSTGGDGFVVEHSVISNCTASNNAANGIVANASNIVENNICSVHANGAGIFVPNFNGAQNLIQGNNCSQNDVGIDVEGTDNVIARNMSGANVGVGVPSANYDIVAGNDVGTIGTAAGAVNPWSNVEY